MVWKNGTSIAFSRKNINHEKIDVYVFIYCQIGMYVYVQEKIFTDFKIVWFDRIDYWKNILENLSIGCLQEGHRGLAGFMISIQQDSQRDECIQGNKM